MELLKEKEGGHLEKYETEKVTNIFDSYQRKLDDLLEQRDKTQEQVIEFETIEKRKQSEQKLFFNRMITMVAMILTTLIASLTIYQFLGLSTKLFFLTIGVITVTFTATITLLFTNRSQQLLKTARIEEERTKNKLKLQRKIAEIESEVNRYNNLMATRSRDLLIDFDKFSGHKKE